MKQSEYRDMVKELCEIDAGLTEWECDFVSAMYDWKDRYTDRQKEVIQKIYDEVVGQ